MSTTIRLEDALKQRIAAAAERAGKTPHAFMRDAIAQTVEQAEQDAAFHQLAESRWAQLLADGTSVGWDDARTWLEARAGGEQSARPVARTPGR